MFVCKRCKEWNVPCIFMSWLDYRTCCNSNVDPLCRATLLPTKTVLRCYLFVYRALAHSECLCGLAHCSVAVNNVAGNTDSTLLNIVLQKKTPKNCFYILCKSSWGYDCLMWFFGYEKFGRTSPAMRILMNGIAVLVVSFWGIEC